MSLNLFWALVRQISDAELELDVTREVADLMLGIANDEYGEDFHDFLSDNMEEVAGGNVCLILSYDYIVSKIPAGMPNP